MACTERFFWFCVCPYNLDWVLKVQFITAPIAERKISNVLETCMNMLFLESFQLVKICEFCELFGHSNCYSTVNQWMNSVIFMLGHCNTKTATCAIFKERKEWESQAYLGWEVYLCHKRCVGGERPGSSKWLVTAVIASANSEVCAQIISANSDHRKGGGGISQNEMLPGEGFLWVCEWLITVCGSSKSSSTKMSIWTFALQLVGLCSGIITSQTIAKEPSMERS